jgi:hypothetical protein
MNLRHRRRLRILGLRALRIARRHYVSLVSAAVLAVAATVALTSASFELPSTEGGAAPPPAQEQALQLPAAAPTATPTATAASTRLPRQVLVYLVSDRAEGDRLILTHNRLVWDNVIVEPFQDVIVRYLIAGTPETEATAIGSLNYFIEIAQLHDDDLRIIDLRPGRSAAAIGVAP